MKQQTYSKNIILILAASFFYFASPMLVTPLITGFSGSIGASAGVMGVIGGLMNLCSLFCRPFVGNLADRISKYRLSFIGAVLMTVACLGYMTASDPYVVIFARMINGVGFACCSVCMSTWMCDMLPKEKNRFRYGILWNDECVRDGDCPGNRSEYISDDGISCFFCFSADVFRLYHFDYSIYF